jgi:serine/threonine protein kinase
MHEPMDVQPSHGSSIKYVSRPVSIKEFIKGETLGIGNFSEIVVVTHREAGSSGEKFALKIIEKKKAEDLAKRQHPNVYNEISMERRVLLERLREPGDGHAAYCPYIIKCYHAFQDYGNLYYLSDLHTEWPDLWTMLREHPYHDNLMIPGTDAEALTVESPTEGQKHGRRKNAGVMVGCHRTTARVWLFQLIDAIEFCHARGIVHRDLKPENILLNSRGHVVVIDFGTAKDMLQPDLNGPDFVGTPDFMPPEAVKGTSGIEESRKAAAAGNLGVSFPVDLWAFGVVAYILHTGTTPFWSASPYLAMLRIARCTTHRSNNRGRPMAIDDDDLWDLICSLLQRDPYTRVSSLSRLKPTVRREFSPLSD